MFIFYFQQPVSVVLVLFAKIKNCITEVTDNALFNLKWTSLLAAWLAE